MPEPKPVIPSSVPASAPAAPAASVTPAAPAVPVTRPAAAVPAKPSIRPPASSTRPVRQSLSAKKALGLEETPGKLLEEEVKKTRAQVQVTTPTTAEYKAPPIEVVPPAEPAAPAVPPPPVAPAAPIPEVSAKIKIGGKEYTPEELEAALKEGKPAPVPAPAPAVPPVQPAPPVPTAEEIAQREAEFVQQTSEAIDAPLTEKEMDAILAGGKEAVQVLTAIRKRDMAVAILQARKGVAAGLNPIMQEIFQKLQPLLQNHETLQRYTVEQQFIGKHKDFAPHVGTARQVAEELLRLYPREIAQMSNEQFIDEVARQTDVLLTQEHKRWFPTGNGNWRQAVEPAPAAPAPVAPAAPAPVVVPAAAAPASRPARPPAAAVPVGGGGAIPPAWGKTVAGSMRN